MNTDIWHESKSTFKTLITELAGQAKGKSFNAKDIASIYNALSKWVNTDIWHESKSTFRALITELAGQAIAKDSSGKKRYFDARQIANIYNALSKWVNTDIWHENKSAFKTLITELAEQAKDKDFNAQEIANIFNALSKWVNTDIWHENESTFRTLITELARQALVIKDFNAQDIANIYNALSKWVNTDIWHENKSAFKTLITELARQALVIKDFNAQHITNIYNALSKWVNTDIWHENKSTFRTLITELARQAKGKSFNAQEIANIYNSLSKWLNTDIWHENESIFRTLITELAGQAKGKSFNAQDIANIYNALSKWVNTDIWHENKSAFKTLITELANQAVAKDSHGKKRDFDAKNIANIYNALSKWVNTDIWHENKSTFRILITELAEQAKGKSFNAQEVANIYNALSKYPKSFIEENKIAFQDLVKVLAEQVINAKQFQKRPSAYIIRDLPQLAHLITNDYPLKNLLISLMKSFTHTEYQSKFADLNKYLSDGSYWTAVGIKDLAESIPKLNLSDDEKEELKTAFDDNIPKILNRLVKFRLNSYSIISILEGVTQLISLGTVSENPDITQSLKRLFESFARYGNKGKLTQKTLEFFEKLRQEELKLLPPDQPIHMADEDLKLTEESIVKENVAEIKKYKIPENLAAFKSEVLSKEGIVYQPGKEIYTYSREDFHSDNVEKGKPKVFIAPVMVLGKDELGIYASESIEAGKFLGTYAGEEMDRKDAERNRKDSVYLFELSKSIIDASKQRNWAAYVNYGINGVANINAHTSYDNKNKQIELSAYEAISPDQQLLLDYGDNYFPNVDYSPIYLHPTDNWKTPKEHYDDHRDFYSNEVIQLPGDMAQNLGLKQKYVAATKLFQAVYSGQKLSVLLSDLSASAIDLPSYSLELTSDKKWKFSEYNEQEKVDPQKPERYREKTNVQQNITPLMLACYLGKEAEVELLLTHGADPIRRTLHEGHNALFLTVLSNIESETKESILDKLIDNISKVLREKSDAFYKSGYEKPNNYNKLLFKDLSNLLQLTDASGSNIFDYMMDKGKYDLWEKYFNYKVGSDEVNSREEKRKIAEKFISDKGIFSAIANGNENYKAIVKILLESTTQKFIDQHLQDLDQSGEINSFETKEIDRMLENLRNLDQANKKGKIVSIVMALLFNETNKIKNQLAQGTTYDISKVQEIKNRFTDILERLGSKNKLDTEIRAIEKLRSSGCLQPGGRRKRAAGSCTLWADKYIEKLRELSTQEQIKFTQANEIDFIGSTHEIKQAENVRDLLLSDISIDQKSYEISNLFEDPIERRILDLFGDMSRSINPKLKQRLMNAAGRIQLFRGIHGTFVSCESRGLSADCMFSVGGIGYSLFLSQLIENSVLKITPRVVNSAASIAGKVPSVLGKKLRFAINFGGAKFGKPIARGVGGAIGSVFDIMDIGMSADTLISCVNRRERGEQLCEAKEIRDSIAGISFGSVSFISGTALTAASMPGIGTVVGFGLMVTQGAYSGVSNIIEYKGKYDTTHDENWRIFWHTFAFQPIPEDVQYLAARTEIVNQMAQQAWKRLDNSTNVVAVATGLGNVAFINERECKEVGKGTSDYHKECTHRMVQVPHVSPNHANIMMSKTNADTAKLARIIPKSPSAGAQMLGLPKWSGQEYEYNYEGTRTALATTRMGADSDNLVLQIFGDLFQIKAAINSITNTKKEPIYSTHYEAIYPCDNAFVIADRKKMANYNQTQTIIFDLSYVDKGKIFGSNERQNIFLIHGGRVQIFGGDNVKNIFHLMNEGFIGRIFGGNNASNVLNFSNLNSSRVSCKINDIYGAASFGDRSLATPNFIIYKIINSIIGVQYRQENIECIANNHEIFVNSGGGESNDKKDSLENCTKVVIWPCTDVTGSDGSYTFYIKPNGTYSENTVFSTINVLGNGTLTFPETSLLNDCDKITYRPNGNYLLFKISLSQGKKFILSIHNYLNENKVPNFNFFDKHGSDIVPIIGETEDSIDIKSFRLNAERTFTNSEEDEAWYKSISQSHEDYQVFGIVKDTQLETSCKIFGSSGVDIVDLGKEVTFAQGRNGSDVYRLDDNTSNKLIAIDNCAEDRELDALWTQQNSVTAHRLVNDLLLSFLPNEDELGHRGVTIKNYFKDPSCQHLIVQKDGDMFIPFNSKGTIRLMPFYHASNSENIFFLPENSTEIVINAHKEDTKFYRYKDDLVLVRDKDNDTTIPLTIVASGFYSDQSKWQGVKPYFWSRDGFSPFDLLQKAAEAVNYEDKIKNDYEKVIKEYVYYNTLSGEITHNQRRLENGTLATIAEDEKRIGVLILKDINPNRIELACSNDDLTLFDKKANHKNLTIRNWNASEGHRISTMEFDLESGRVVVRKLDRFNLTAEGITAMQQLLSTAALNVEGPGVHNETHSTAENVTEINNSTASPIPCIRQRRSIKIPIGSDILSEAIFRIFGVGKEILLEPKKDDMMEVPSEIEQEIWYDALEKLDNEQQPQSNKYSLPQSINTEINKENVPSGASRTQSWINAGVAAISWVKNSITGFIASPTEQVNSNIVQPGSVFVDGFLILSDVGVRKFTGNKYKQPKHDSLLSPKELIERRMDYTAINAINNFEKVCDDKRDNNFQNATVFDKPMTCFGNISLENQAINMRLPAKRFTDKWIEML